MRKLNAWLLSILMIFTLVGCHSQETFQKPVKFYYQAIDLSFDVDSTTILPETREGKDFSSLEDMLHAYFDGPEDQKLKSPFPSGVQLIRLQRSRQTLNLTLSDDIGRLSGLALTMACSCIALTALEFADVDAVCIQAETALLNGESSITLTRENLDLLDESK